MGAVEVVAQTLQAPREPGAYGGGGDAKRGGELPRGVPLAVAPDDEVAVVGIEAGEGFFERITQAAALQRGIRRCDVVLRRVRAGFA